MIMSLIFSLLMIVFIIGSVFSMDLYRDKKFKCKFPVNLWIIIGTIIISLIPAINILSFIVYFIVVVYNEKSIEYIKKKGYYGGFYINMTNRNFVGRFYLKAKKGFKFMSRPLN